MRKLMLAMAVVLATTTAAAAAATGAGAATGDGAGTAGKVYVVSTSHLDTQWRWTIQTTIDEYLRNTLHDNFSLLEKYPDYVFSFEGAFRYQLMKEYYPAEYARLKEYARAGRWHVCGSWVDAVDTNMPAPETLVRHVLYGNGWFDRELGQRSVDVFLPDCFGFGYALPAVMRHCGLTGFSSQKLTWGSAYGVPFDVGVWRGVGGAEVTAALNPGAYDNDLVADVSRDSTVIAALGRTTAAGGPAVAMKYYGTGDVGGSPKESSVQVLEQSLTAGGPAQVVSAAADQLFRELTPAQVASLPRYDGELVMTSHGAGCYTAQAVMKRWNRRNETLAAAAEGASSLAAWLGGKAYPHQELERAWTRFMWHQFHDDLTGTSIPEAYTFSWNDELLSQQEFAQVLTDAVGAVSRVLDTRVAGEPLVVYNPLGFARTDLVTIPGWRRVYDADGKPLPQLAGAAGTTFAATVPACGFRVFDVREAEPEPRGSRWDAKTGTLDTPRYRLVLGAQGLTSLFDKQARRELLAAPPRLQLLRDDPMKWPAWEVDYDDLMTAPYAEVPLGGVPVTVEDADGVFRATFRHEAEGSIFDQVLTVDDSGRVTWDLDIDWRTTGTLLKAAFFTTARDTTATFDLGLGVIRRGLNRPRLYEVPAQRWADVTDASGAFGLAVLNDCRYGWDRPDAGTLRLSLIHTPAVNPRWEWVGDEKSMDLGHHRLAIALVGHGAGWHPDVPRQADRLNQPLLAFACDEKHAGAYGREVSLVALKGDDPRVAIKAVKFAEDGRGLVVRVQETAGKAAAGVTVQAIAPVGAVRELRGDEVEAPLGADVRLKGGALGFDLPAFGMRTFALDLAPVPADRRLAPPRSEPLDLAWNRDGISTDDAPTDGDFDGQGRTLPGEVIPAEFTRDGVTFRTGPRGPGQANLLACLGQVVDLPVDLPFAGRVEVLACALTPDGNGNIANVPDGRSFFGQWDSRVVGPDIVHDPEQMIPAYVRDADLGWIVTHRHGADGRNEPYVFTDFHRFSGGIFAVVGGKLRLPNEPGLRVLAASVTDGVNNHVKAVTPLLDRPRQPSLVIHALNRAFCDSVDVMMTSPNPGAVIRFTLDGSQPTLDSPAYAGGPLRLTESSVLTAMLSARDFATTTTRRATFTKVAPWPVPAGAPTSAGRPGLSLRCYEGAWEKLPDFAALSPVLGLEGQAVGLPKQVRDEDIGLAFTGWLVAPRDGMYRLYLSSDDGSRLWLDGQLAIDADGLHGATEHVADVPLAAGPHRLRLDFFQHLGGRGLDLLWSGPGIAKQAVPVEALRGGE